MLRSLTVAVLLHFLLLPALLLADDFSDFRVPRHQVLTARAAFNSYYHGSQGHSGGGLSDLASGDNSQIYGTLQPYGSWLFDLDPLRLEVELYALLRGQTTTRRSASADTSNGRSQYRTERIKDLLEQYQLNAGTRVYPWAFPLGLDVSTSLWGKDGQVWSTYYVRDSDDDVASREYQNHETWNFGYHATGSASLGLGRVRDASGVYDVYALEARLLELKVLTRPLLPATRQRLADLIYLSGDYSRVHERPARFFWREVEAALNEDGGLRVEGLDAYSLYRIAEAYFGRYSGNSGSFAAVPAADRPPVSRPGTGFPSYVLMSGPARTTGWFVGPTLRVTHDHTISRRHDRYSTEQSAGDSSWIENSADASVRETTASDNVLFGARGEYHRPIGLRWQFDGTSELIHPYDDHDRIKGESFQFNSSARLTRFILDRWLITTRFSHQRYLQTDRSNAGDWFNRGSWGTTATMELYYYLEDHLSLSLTAGQSQSHNRDSDHNLVYNRGYDVFVGLTYQLAGRLSAPGVAAPSTIQD